MLPLLAVAAVVYLDDYDDFCKALNTTTMVS